MSTFILGGLYRETVSEFVGVCVHGRTFIFNACRLMLLQCAVALGTESIHHDLSGWESVSQPGKTNH